MLCQHLVEVAFWLLWIKIGWILAICKNFARFWKWGVTRILCYFIASTNKIGSSATSGSCASSLMFVVILCLEWCILCGKLYKYVNEEKFKRWYQPIANSWFSIMNKLWLRIAACTRQTSWLYSKELIASRLRTTPANELLTLTWDGRSHFNYFAL